MPNNHYSQQWLIDAASSGEKNAKLPENFLLSDNIIEAWSQIQTLFDISSDELAQKVAAYAGLPKASIDRIDLSSASFLSEQYCRELKVLPLREDDDHRYVFAVSDVSNLDDLNTRLRFACNHQIAFEIMPPEMLDTFHINLFARADRDHNKLPIIDLNSEPSANSETGLQTIRLMYAILAKAIDSRASDIHIHPFVGGAAIRFRIDGVLERIATIPAATLGNLSRYVKVHGGMDPSNNLIAQDGRLRLLYNDEEYDARLSLLPCKGGERIVTRLLEQNRIYSLHGSGFAHADEQALRRMVSYPSGIVLMTGPTGSGKTSSLYALLAELNTVDINIMTIEDPVEYSLPGTSQVHVNTKQGLTFASSLRSILRQDPDVILVGEIRDAETAEIAMQAALTGHLVLSTLHTNDALTTIPRLLNLGLDSSMLADSLIGVAAQRLLRRLCDACAKPVTEPLTLVEQSFFEVCSERPAYRAVGCDKCNFTGYRGRLPVIERIEINAAMREAIFAGQNDLETLKQSIGAGYRPMAESAQDRIVSGETTVKEANRVLGIRFWNELAQLHGKSAENIRVIDDKKLNQNNKLELLLISHDIELSQQLADGLLFSIFTAADGAQASEHLKASRSTVAILVDSRAFKNDHEKWLTTLRSELAWAGLPAIFLVPESDDELNEILQRFNSTIIEFNGLGNGEVIDIIRRTLNKPN